MSSKAFYRAVSVSNRQAAWESLLFKCLILRLMLDCFVMGVVFAWCINSGNVYLGQSVLGVGSALSINADRFFGYDKEST